MIALGIQVSLGFLWDFLKPILSEAMKARLKPKGSAETAKRRALHLYETLGEVNQKTDDFVIALQSLAELFEKEAAEKTIVEKQLDLGLAAHHLIYALPELASALDAINPQLEIHQNELVQEIDWYRMARIRILTKLEESVFEIGSESKTTLQQLVTQADENRNLIRKATEDFRSFLAKKFSFKESF